MVSLAALILFAQAQPAPATSSDSLLGEWTVDLRPTPDAAPYLQSFTVESVEKGSLKGVFYGTAFEGGRINSDWGTLRFAFVTKDASSTYFHSGKLEKGKLQGTTYSPEREFLAVWTAVRKAD